MNIERPTRHFRIPWKSRKLQRKPPKDGAAKDSESAYTRRLPFVSRLPIKIRGHIVAFIGEFVGTFLFLLIAFGGTNVVNTAPAEGASALDLAANPSKIMFIALCFGMSLAVNAWVFFRISGGLFNPAVSLGMMIVGALGYMRGALVILAQMLAGICAAAVVSALFPNVLAVSTVLGGGTSIAQGLFIEMFLTAQLVFTIFMLAAEKHQATFIAPVGIGLSLFIAELVGIYYTGGSLNPARSFGPCVVNKSFQHYHWIYWLGPILGAVLASGFYILVKTLEYESVNLEVDPNEIVGKVFDPLSRREKLITRDGTAVDALTGDKESPSAQSPERVLSLGSDTSRVNGRQSQPFAQGPNLESQRHTDSIQH